MKLVYTHENKILVENARNCIREKGIEGILKNEFSAGGVGELSPLETWPELWVQEPDFERAKDIVFQLVNAPLDEKWVCFHCCEENAIIFEICWNCQREASLKNSARAGVTK